MKTEEKSDFLVMQEMSSGNMDIACAVDILNYDRTKKGGKVTFGVASPQFDHLINQVASGKTTHYAIMYIVNKEQFDKIKQEAVSKVDFTDTEADGYVFCGKCGKMKDS